MFPLQNDGAERGTCDGSSGFQPKSSLEVLRLSSYLVSVFVVAYTAVLLLGIPLKTSLVAALLSLALLPVLSTAEAARYFYQAAQGDWENPVLVERAFIAFAADGQIGQAAATAKHLLDLDPNNELAELVVATEALKERRYSAAERMLGAIGQDSFTGITAGILRAWALVGDNRKDEADAALDQLGQSGLEYFLVFHRALMAEASGDTDEAIKLAGRAFEAEPYVAHIVEVYARILANAGANAHQEVPHLHIHIFGGQGLGRMIKPE